MENLDHSNVTSGMASGAAPVSREIWGNMSGLA